MELNNTIILPGDDPALAKQLLSSLIQDEDVLTLIIFGKDQLSADTVKKADIRANAVVSGVHRKVAWMRDISLLDYLKELIKPGTDIDTDAIDVSKHIGIAVSMTDVLKDILPISPAPDYVRLELAYIRAGKY